MLIYIRAWSIINGITPTLSLPLSGSNREPLAFRAAAGAVLRCSPRINLNGDGCLSKRFFARNLIDLPAQLIGLLTVASVRFAFPFDRLAGEPLLFC